MENLQEQLYYLLCSLSKKCVYIKRCNKWGDDIVFIKDREGTLQSLKTPLFKCLSILEVGKLYEIKYLIEALDTPDEYLDECYDED